MKKLWIAIVAIALIGAGIVIYLPKNDESATSEEVIKEINVKQSDIVIDFIADGNVYIPTVEQKFLATGILAETFVQVGDLVEKGDVIAKLDTRELELKLKQAELSLQSEEDKLSQSESDAVLDIKKQESVVLGLSYDLKEAEDLLATMKTYPELYAASVIAAQENKVSEIGSNLSLQNSILSNIKNESTLTSNTAYEQAKLDIELIQMDLENAYLYAQSSGTIAYLNQELGSNITTTTVSLVIQDTTHPQVISNISELDIYQVFEGQSVNLSFDSDYGVAFKGNVSFVNPIPNIDNNNIVTYEVIIDLMEYPENLRSGLTTMANIILKEKEDILVIPNTAVSIVDNKQMVELKTEEGYEMVNVITGLTDGMSVEVIQGLVQGDVVITRTQK
ncbi:MAG: HlyD family efflux transporter periplasmic adaptor subunit [Clostridia bacterium]|nr:HlyD family efflux transporter periplasmic adaptor subunit [Clostridia bacterium]